MISRSGGKEMNQNDDENDINNLEKIELQKTVRNENYIDFDKNIKIFDDHDKKTSSSEFDDFIVNDFAKKLSLVNNNSVEDGKLLEEHNEQLSPPLKITVDTILYNNQADDNDETIFNKIKYVNYQDETQMPDIMRLIQKDLSEPYSIYTYRYFIHNWPQLCFLAMDNDHCIGAIVCKLDYKKRKTLRGYIAMLAVDEQYRKKKIGSNLVLKAIRVMIDSNADEVVLETEVTNKPALMLYENLGFVRDKRLFRYYLNGVDALRLKLWLR